MAVVMTQPMVEMATIAMTKIGPPNSMFETP
jgi:hypothetical protein